MYGYPVGQEGSGVKFVEVQMQEAITDDGDHGWNQVREDIHSLIVNESQAINAQFDRCVYRTITRAKVWIVRIPRRHVTGH